MLVCEISVIGFQRRKYFSTLTTNCQQGNDSLQNLFRVAQQLTYEKQSVITT